MGKFAVVTIALFFAAGLALRSAAGGEHGHGHGDHKAEGEKHGHTSPHGGVVKSIGDHHAELVFTASSGKLELYVLGEDEKKAVPIDAKELTAQVKLEGKDDFQAVALKVAPLKEEKEGAASHFEGTSDVLKGAKNFEAVIQITIGGKKHRASFSVKAGDEHKEKEHHK